MKVRCIDDVGSYGLKKGEIYTVVEHEDDDYPDYRLAGVEFTYDKTRFTTNLTDTPTASIDQTNPKDILGITKPRIDLIPPASLIYQSLAMALGADKYGPYNWRSKKVKMTIYIAATMRHLMSLLDRQDDDEESGSPHIGHALACLGILADARETGNLIDDRPVKGVAAELIKKYTKKRTA